MNRGVKGFITGVIVTLMATSIVFADGVIRTIEVAFNTIKLQVNGVDVDADNILYNGTTYVPIRRVAEMFGKDVKWNSETSTVNINENNQISQSTIKLSAAPEVIKINNKEYRLKADLWRDFMPISPPDGKPLITIVNIHDENNNDAIDEMTIDRLWIINGHEIWETDIAVEGNGSFKRMVARNGPKWGPDIQVDVVVRVIDRAGNEYLLKASNQKIERTD